MTFAILGPVEIRAGNRPVAVTPARPQALLAATLLQANAVVPTSRLVEAIWGDEPPGAAPELVRTYVSALRRSIGGRIVARPSGYLVTVERGALDLHQFERLSAEAERAAAGGDHERATRLLGDALARWRGPALAGLDSPLFRAAAARLEELRLRATERRFESASHLGDPAWMVPELTAFVAEHPRREGVRALLVLVLARLGRQADALRVYQQGQAVPDRSHGQGVQALQQVVGGQLHVLVAPLGGPVDAGDQAGAVHAAEVAVDERVPRLGLLGRALGESQVPLGVVGP
jgi:DNA-binding SARP family transcriptional activator